MRRVRSGDDRRIVLAANHGGIGGGEVMLLRMAHAARDLGLDVQVVAPADPGEVVAAAEGAGFDTVALPGRGRRSYLVRLAAWERRHRRGLLWCHGLLPALATAGARRRIVELHRLPDPSQRPAVAVARRGARLVVPSQFLAQRVPGSTVLHNWTADTVPVADRDWRRPVRVGFLGRYAEEKGLLVLAEAMSLLEPGSWRLLVAGPPTFVGPAERQRLDSAVDALGGAVDRTGWMSRDEFFGTVDLAVFPSVVAESFGLVVAEAMAAGVPFVASRTGAFAEVVGADHPWLAPPGDPEALAASIRHLVTSSAEDRDRVVTAGRRRWTELYSPMAGRRHLAGVLTDAGLSTADLPEPMRRASA